jgi:hypothetical protein
MSFANYGSNVTDGNLPISTGANYVLQSTADPDVQVWSRDLTLDSIAGSVGADDVLNLGNVRFDVVADGGIATLAPASSIAPTTDDSLCNKLYVDTVAGVNAIGNVTSVTNANTVPYIMTALPNSQGSYPVLRNAANNNFLTLDIDAGFIYAIQCEAYMTLADGPFTCDALALGCSSTLGGELDIGAYSYQNGISQLNVATASTDNTLFITNTIIYKCSADDTITMFVEARAQSEDMTLGAGAGQATLTATVIGTFTPSP